MSAITRIISDRYISKMAWTVPKVKQWLVNAAHGKIEEKSETMAFDAFPDIKWSATVRKSDKFEFIVNIVRYPANSEAGVNFNYVVKARIIRGTQRVDWIYLESSKEPLDSSSLYWKALGPISDTHKYLNGDNFEVNISVELYQNKVITISTQPLSQKAPVIDLIAQMGKMLETGDFSDVSVVADGKRYNLHKSILSSRSKFFAEYFTTNPNVSSLELNSKVSPKVFDIFIRYIYTADATYIEDINEVTQLFSLGHEYQIQDMKEIYESLLETRLTDKNALDMFCYALKYNSSYGLKERAFALVQKQYKDCGIRIPSQMVNRSYEQVKEFIETEMSLLELDLGKLSLSAQ